MLDLGFVSAILPDYDLENVFLFAAKHGFSCVEVMCWPTDNADARRYAGVSHIDVAALDAQRVAQIHQLQQKTGVYISALGYYPNPLDPDTDKAEVFQRHIRRLIEAAALLGVGRVNTFVGRDPQRNVADNLQKFAEVWPSIIQLADAQKVKVGIENCPMFFTNDEWPGGKNLATTPAIWDQMFNLIPSPNFGLNYDPSHLVWQMMDEVAPIYDYKERLHHIHLKDVKVYRHKLNRVGIMANPLEYHSPKLPGLGDVNWRAFFTAITDVRYRGPLCIEVEDKAYEGSAVDVQSAILTARNYVKQFLP
jgi:sugar phosphate isomerase/epimerase